MFALVGGHNFYSNSKRVFELSLIGIPVILIEHAFKRRLSDAGLP